jgi:hypothetical protein
MGAGSISRDATTEIAALVVLVSGVVAGIGHLGYLRCALCLDRALAHRKVLAPCAGRSHRRHRA